MILLANLKSNRFWTFVPSPSVVSSIINGPLLGLTWPLNWKTRPKYNIIKMDLIWQVNVRGLKQIAQNYLGKKDPWCHWHLSGVFQSATDERGGLVQGETHPRSQTLSKSRPDYKPASTQYWPKRLRAQQITWYPLPVGESTPVSSLLISFLAPPPYP